MLICLSWKVVSGWLEVGFASVVSTGVTVWAGACAGRAVLSVDALDAEAVAEFGWLLITDARFPEDSVEGAWVAAGETPVLAVVWVVAAVGEWAFSRFCVGLAVPSLATAMNALDWVAMAESP